MPQSGITITQAIAHDYEWLRERPISNGSHTYATSDITVVEIRTDAGVTGYGIGRPRPGEREFRADFLSRLVGRDATMTEAIWASLWSPKMSGRRGYETRALSSIDLALWDVKAKYAGLPLSRLLGGYRQEIPFYIAGGYYGQGKSMTMLREEFARYVELGAKAVKMKVGAVSVLEDIARIKAVRATIGDEVALLLDANCAYSWHDAVELARRAEPFQPFWFEEPVPPDDYDGFRRIAAHSAIRLAAGENEYTKYGFRDLIATGVIAIINPDARYMGGATEFMKVAALAQAHGVDVAPHGDQQTHLQLLGAIPNARLLEFYPPAIEPMQSRAYLNPPVMTDHGTVLIPEQPGAGLDPDFEALEPYRLA